MAEATGPGMVAPTLTAGSNWKFPTTTSMQMPTSFSGWARKNNYYDKPMFQALQKAQYLVQNIVSIPEFYGITTSNISGDPQSGGWITGLDKNRMISAGASRGLRFLPAEFDMIEKARIFVDVPAIGTDPPTVSINLGELYQKMKKEIGRDAGKDVLANAADTVLQQAVTPGQNAQTLQRAQYAV